MFGNIKQVFTQVQIVNNAEFKYFEAGVFTETFADLFEIIIKYMTEYPIRVFVGVNIE